MAPNPTPTHPRKRDTKQPIPFVRKSTHPFEWHIPIQGKSVLGMAWHGMAWLGLAWLETWLEPWLGLKLGLNHGLARNLA